MTKAQFLSGAPFAVFGIEKDMKYLPKTEKVVSVGTENTTGISSHVLFPENYDDTHFTAFLPVFGITQAVMISYAYCELK